MHRNTIGTFDDFCQGIVTKNHSDVGNTTVAAVVNDEYVPLEYKLKNKDRVKIITDELFYGPCDEWEKIAKTTRAKRKIREFNKK